MTSSSSSNTKWGIPRALVEPAFPTPGMHLGGYTLLSRCQDHPLAERWIARCDHASDNGVGARRVMLYRLTVASSREAQPAPLDHPHLLRADQTTLRTGAGRWLCSKYPGRWSKVFVLASTMRQRETGGCRPVEAALLAQHLLAASAHAHDAGVCHGPISVDEILISPSGGALLELYALGRRLRGERGFDDQQASLEVASIARIAETLAPVEEHGRHAKPLAKWAHTITSSAEFDGVGASEALASLIDAMKLPA